MKSNKKKCQESIDTMYNEIQKCFNDLVIYQSVCSSSIIDCRTEKIYNTEWVCDKFFYDDIKKSLVNIERYEKYLDILVKNTRTGKYERQTEHQAFITIEQLIKCKFFNNLIATATEKIIKECLSSTYQVLLMEERYINYDIIVDGDKIDVKNVKLKNSLNFHYDHEKIIRYDSIELERIAKHLIISQQNNNSDTSKMCKHLLFCLFVDEKDDMQKITLCEMNFNKLRRKFTEIALSKTLEDYTLKVIVNNEEFSVTMVVFSSDETDAL